MFSDIKTISSSKIVEVREFLDFLLSHSPPPPANSPRYINSGKGLFYVHVYGVIEYTVYNSVAKTINFINADALKIEELKPLILSLALNDQLDALINVTTKKWHKRLAVFQHLTDNTVVNIASDLMPTDGRNVRYAQLESIWKVFCITDPILHDIRFGGRLKDIVDNRNNIAHGKMSPWEVGSRVSFNDLTIKLNEVSAFCTYLISVLEDYVSQKKYKR